MLAQTIGDLFSTVLRSLAYCGFLAIGSLSQGLIVFSHPIFAQLEAGISHALFFVDCDANPDTREIPDAMRIKGYSPSEATDQLLQQQVRREMDKIQGEAIPGPPASTRRTSQYPATPPCAPPPRRIRPTRPQTACRWRSRALRGGTSPPPSPCCHNCTPCTRSSAQCCFGGDGGRSKSAGAGFVSFAPRGKIRHRISIAVYPRLKRRRGGTGQGLGHSHRVGRFTTPRLTRTPRCSCLASPPPNMRRRWRW